MTKYFTKDGDNYVEVSDNLLTQPEVDSVVEARLERHKKQVATQYADYDDLKATAAKVGTIETEYKDKLKAEADAKADLEKQLGSAKLETEKVKIVHKYKLSDDLHEFVVGDSVEDMEKRAEKLSKGITGGVVVDKDTKPEDKPTASKQIAGKLFGKKSDD